jgi:hypothetical protein
MQIPPSLQASQIPPHSFEFAVLPHRALEPESRLRASGTSNFLSDDKWQTLVTH